MIDELPVVPLPGFNEANIRTALIDAQGDLYVASQLLGHVTMMRLDRAIRLSPDLQNVFLNLKQIKSLPEYDRLSQEQLEAELNRRMALYRADGLEAIHDLATMGIGDNSAMAQVKLAAAARLTGGVHEKENEGDLAHTLNALNEAYYAHAPRIKLTRTTTIEVDRPESVISGELDG